MYILLKSVKISRRKNTILILDSKTPENNDLKIRLI